MAADRILYATTEGETVVDLAGAQRFLGFAHDVYGFDGQQEIVDDGSCAAKTLISQGVLGQDPPLPLARVLACPVRFSDARLYLGTHPRLVVTIRCPLGCIGPIVAGTRNLIERSSKRFSIRPRRRRRITIRLSPRGHIVRAARRSAAHRLPFNVYINTFSVNDDYDPNKTPVKNASDGVGTWHQVRAQLLLR